MDEDKIIEERKEKALKFFKSSYDWIVYVVLAIIVFIAVKIRMLPLAINPGTGKPGLWDITTNDYTLGPDLDPFLFLRWAKTIVAQGFLPFDAMRYVPIGFDVKQEVLLHPYFIAWFHKLFSLFTTTTVTYSAIIYPVFMFALTVIAFFFLVRKLFINDLGLNKSNVLALIASLFLSLIPSLLPRTIAGIPEKEASGFLFLFLTFYLFLLAWKSEKLRNKLILSALAGISTALMAGVWGGYVFIFLPISLAILVAFLLGQMDRDKLYIFAIWLFVSFFVMNLISVRYSWSILFTSTTTLIPLIILGVLIVDLIISIPFIKKFFKSFESRLPSPLVSLLVTIVLGAIISTTFFGLSYIPDKIGDMTKPLIQPISDRLGVTVAENRQPFFSEWTNDFGPVVSGIPIFFWLFIIGSVYLYHEMVRVFNKKERIFLTLGYSFFLFALIFSRYSSSSLFNGTNFISLSFYLLGVIALVGSFGVYYFRYYKQGEIEKLKSIDFGLILIFSLFFLSIVSARGAVRLIMVLAPSAAILSAYLAVVTYHKAEKAIESRKILLWIWSAIVIIVLLFSAYQYYQQSTATAQSYVPSIYTQQWQKAMSWVRDNTSLDSVFSHWWDYGYWVQSMGERATIVDGGNQYSYWDYLVGRHVLTTPSSYDAMEFLYSHNTTHLLIDSSDIGKYGAFSTIGSNENYDRASYISFFSRNDQQSPPQEMKNSTFYIYYGGSAVDDDIIQEINGSKILLPGSYKGDKASVGAILLEIQNNGTLAQPQVVFIYQNKQYKLPLRYAFFNGKFIDFGSGVASGIYVMPLVSVTSQGSAQIDNIGIIMFLSNRTVNSELARLYLYKQDDPYFKLVHSEDDAIVAQLKQNGANVPDIIYYQGFRGPIRIWEIKYPNNVYFNPEYLKLDYPNKELQIAKQ